MNFFGVAVMDPGSLTSRQGCVAGDERGHQEHGGRTGRHQTPVLQARASANIYIKVTFFICLQVLDYWTVEVSSSYISAGMGNLPEGKR